MDYLVEVLWRGSEVAETAFRGQLADARAKAAEISALAAADRVTVCTCSGLIVDHVKDPPAPSW